MGKRQIRLSSSELLSNTNTFIGKEINLVLKAGHTICGEAIKIDLGKLIVKDHFLQKHNVRLEEIEEIVLDFVAEY